MDFISSKVMDCCWFSCVVVAYLCKDAAALDLDDGARKADTADHCAASNSSSSRDRDIMGIIVFGNNISERRRGMAMQAKTSSSGMF